MAQRRSKSLHENKFKIMLANVPEMAIMLLSKRI